MKSSSSFSYLLLLIILLTIIHSNLFAQQDSLSIQQRIFQSQETDQVIIMRTRDFIFNKLIAGNITEAAEAYNYAINQFEKEKVKPFWLNEKFLLSYWFGDYNHVYKADSLYNVFKSQIDFYGYPTKEILFPQKDELTVDLDRITYQNKIKLLQKVDSLVSDSEKRDYLILFFDWVTLRSTDSIMTYEQENDYLVNNLTPRAEKFLETYKDSQFTPFVSKYFRYVYELNDFGYGFQFGLGTLMPQGKASNYLSTEFTFLVNLNLSWKDLLIDLGFDMGIPVAIKKPFIYEQKYWDTDIRHNYFTAYLSTGLVAKETGFIKLTPHLGVGAMNMSVCEADKDKANGDFSMTQGFFQVGVSCDFKFGFFPFDMSDNIHTYSGISLALNYNQFLGNNPVMKDGIIQLRVSWIGFIRNLVRDI